MSSPKIHPATLVINIKNCVLIQLDEGAHFNTWYTLFKLHCRANLVEDHINLGGDSKASSSTDPEWQRLGDIVRTWIYATISIDLLKNVVQPNDNAKDAWSRILQNFQNNKTCRILYLEALSNVKAYCTELNTIATTLNILGTSITDDRLAMQLLRGLV